MYAILTSGYDDGRRPDRRVEVVAVRGLGLTVVTLELLDGTTERVNLFDYDVDVVDDLTRVVS